MVILSMCCSLCSRAYSKVLSSFETFSASKPWEVVRLQLGLLGRQSVGYLSGALLAACTWLCRRRTERPMMSVLALLIGRVTNVVQLRSSQRHCCVIHCSAAAAAAAAARSDCTRRLTSAVEWLQQPHSQRVVCAGQSVYDWVRRTWLSAFIWWATTSECS